MMEWQPIATAPRDGTKFIATDSNRMEFLNQPPGCVMGKWEKRRNGEWRGHAVSMCPTLWMKAPKLPEPPK